MNSSLNSTSIMISQLNFNVFFDFLIHFIACMPRRYHFLLAVRLKYRIAQNCLTYIPDYDIVSKKFRKRGTPMRRLSITSLLTSAMLDRLCSVKNSAKSHAEITR